MRARRRDWLFRNRREAFARRALDRQKHTARDDKSKPGDDVQTPSRLGRNQGVCGIADMRQRSHLFALEQ